jgi:hypothetical protein
VNCPTFTQHRYPPLDEAAPVHYTHATSARVMLTLPVCAPTKSQARSHHVRRNGVIRHKKKVRRSAR